ncbi:hypothetical protein SpCBS45565_g01672 [Spizellomyces sp. 'palustris']|nr:hypothetical protein SpCBS45565_g01672 [Spizellomyces sp. 'palustris']
MFGSSSIDPGHTPLSMSFTNTTSELLVATSSRSLMLINLFRGSIIRQLDVDDNVTVMKQARVICCGTATGRVGLRDPRTLKEEHSLMAHTGTIGDLDVAGNIMITCGFSARGNKMMTDPMIKLFDIRTMRALPPIPFPSGPNYLHFHPKISSIILAASQNGQFQLCDVANASNVRFFQANISGFLNSIEFSSSGEMLACGDSSGVVSLWTEKPDCRVNLFSRPTEFADTPAPPPAVEIEDKSPLSLIGMPYYTSELLSSWPAKVMFEAGQPAPKIPPEVLANVKMIDFVGYAPNPGTFRRNQNLAMARKARKEMLDVPKFRSEQDREKYFGKNAQGRDTPQGVDEEVVNAVSLANSMPKYYRRVEIKYSKFGVEDFDFGFYNKTSYGGLETHIVNSYCNAMLQVLFFTKPLREITKAHINANCPKEYCLSCELGFLFRMLEDAKGANCQATNFLRAFKTIPQANALGLFEPDQPNPSTSYATLIQNFNRFVLEQLQSELGMHMGTVIIPRNCDKDQMPSVMQQIYGLKLQAVSHCQCNSQQARDTCPFVVDLTYSWKGSHAKSTKDRFGDVLQHSINRASSTKAWCNSCKRYQPTTQFRRLQRPPNVLSINAGATTEEDLDLYRSEDKPWLPPRIALILDGSKLTVKELGAGETSIDIASETAEVAMYDLMATVVEIGEGKELPHLVAHVRVDDGESVPSWYVFNDFLVQPVPDIEARQFKKRKIPSVIQYRRTDLNQVQDFNSLRTSPDPTYLRTMVLLNRRREKDLKISYKLLKPEELPTKPGFLCALDAEFVALSKDETEIRSDGTRSVIRPSRLSLARVSVLRGDGPEEGIPFIDEYISTTEEVVDYLTEFSGIKAGDLDMAHSRHPLVSLKSSYKKLRLLVDLGCVFVGHGLKKDFRIINILVPPEQVIDTVDLFFIQSRQRKLSLRFLAWYVLRQDIQTDMHDSVEDSRTALALYKRYLQLKREGRFQQYLEEVYEEGRRTNFKPPSKPIAPYDGQTFTLAGVHITELPP